MLTITGVGINPTRTGLLDILALMGADLRVVNHRSAGAEPVADIEVRPAQLKGIHVPEHLVPLAIDEFPRVVRGGLLRLKGGDENEEALVEICLHDDVSGDQVEQATRDIASQAGIAAQDVVVKDGKAKIKVPRGRLRRLAGIDEVKTINQFRERRLFNNVATGILEAGSPIGPGNTIYKGKGQVVCVADTGFDTGDITNCHHAFQGRVRSVHALGRSGTNEADDPDGHGTHVCGSVLGKGQHSSQGNVEAAASESELIVQPLPGLDTRDCGRVPK